MRYSAKRVALFEPETTIKTVWRFFPLWGLVLITVISLIAKGETDMLVIGIVTALALGSLFSLRSMNPDFFATSWLCGFGMRSTFKTKHALICHSPEKPHTILVCNERRGVTLPVWQSDSPQDKETVLRELRRFIAKEA